MPGVQLPPFSTNGHVSREMSDFVARLCHSIDATIKKLGQAKFREDPIGGKKYSRATSIISSAYKRHGQILRLALLERLKDCEHLRVWQEEKFKLSHESLKRAQLHPYWGKCSSVQLPYGEGERTVPVDIVVFDKKTGILCSYNVKRGNGAYDAGKKDALFKELLRVQMLLFDYGRQSGFKVNIADTRVIFYYGLRSIEAPISLVGSELDEHFQFPVQGAIDAVNEYFRTELYRLVEQE
jgi:hypothetical protein